MKVILTYILVILHISVFSQNLLPLSKITYRTIDSERLIPNTREVMRYDDRNNLIYKATYHNLEESEEPKWQLLTIDELDYNTIDQLIFSKRESYQPTDVSNNRVEKVSENQVSRTYNDNGDILEFKTLDLYYNNGEENKSCGRNRFIYNENGCLVEQVNEINNVRNVNNGDWFELSRVVFISDESCNQLFWEIYEGGKYAGSREIVYDETGEIVFDEYKSYMNETILTGSFTTEIEKDQFFRTTVRRITTQDILNDYESLTQYRYVYSDKETPDSTYFYNQYPGNEFSSISVHQYDNQNREIGTQVYQEVDSIQDSIMLIRERELEYAFDNQLAYSWSKRYGEEEGSYSISEQTTEYTEEQKVERRYTERGEYVDNELISKYRDEYLATFDCSGLLQIEQNYQNGLEFWRTEFNYPLTSPCEKEEERFSNVRYLQNLGIVDIWTQFLSGLDTQVQLISTDGKVLNQFTTDNRLHLTLPVQELASGIYYLNLMNDNANIVEPLWINY